MLVTLAAASCLAMASVTRAEDASPAASPSPFCAILTEAEVSAAVKVNVVIDSSSDMDCDYASVQDYTYVDVRVETGAIDDALRNGFPDFEDVTIAGQPGLLVPDGSLLYIQTDFGLLTIQLSGGVGEGATVTQALEALGATAFGRLASVSFPVPSLAPVASSAPAPSFGGAPDLAALFPATIDGQPLPVQTIVGQQIAGLVTDPTRLKLITDALTALSKTIDDLTIGIGGSAIIALRVQGVDGASTEQAFLPFLEAGITTPVQAAATVGGKSVMTIADGSASPSAATIYVYASGDVLWAVKAVDPELTEVFTKLH
jgi:hypothetical protein